MVEIGCMTGGNAIFSSENISLISKKGMNAWWKNLVPDKTPLPLRFEMMPPGVGKPPGRAKRVPAPRLHLPE